MEKTKNNKVLFAIIGIVVAAIVVAIIVGVVFVSSKKNKEEDSYKTQIKDFAKAISSEEKMEEFVEKNIDYRALYAVKECGGDADEFENEYKDAEKDDYEDEEFIDQIKQSANYYVDEDISKLEVKSIGELKEPDEEDGMPDGFKYAKATFVDDEDTEYTGTFYFYKEKLCSFSFYEK